MRVAQPGADGDHAPAGEILLEWRFGKPLHDGVVVHHRPGRRAIELRQGRLQPFGQVEASGLSIAGKVLGAVADAAILLDQTRAADADPGRDP
jgi:hypothetical protein